METNIEYNFCWECLSCHSENSTCENKGICVQHDKEVNYDDSACKDYR